MKVFFVDLSYQYIKSHILPWQPEKYKKSAISSPKYKNLYHINAAFENTNTSQLSNKTCLVTLSYAFKFNIFINWFPWQPDTCLLIRNFDCY